MAKFHTDVQGLEKASRRVLAYPMTVRRAVKGVLSESAEAIMTESKRIVPVDTGTLMNSGHVQPVKEDASGEISVTLGYGGPAAKSAVEVHENLDPRINWQRPGSGPKYLERPVKEDQGKIPGRIATAVKGLIR